MEAIVSASVRRRARTIVCSARFRRLSPPRSRPVADDLARAGRDRCHAGETCERRLRAQPPRLRPGDEDRGRADRSDPAPGEQAGCELPHAPGELHLEHLGLRVQLAHAQRRASEARAPQVARPASARRGRRRIPLDERRPGEPLQALPELGRSGDDERPQLVQRRVARADGALARREQRAQRLRLRAEPGRRARLAGEHQRGSTLGVEDVRLQPTTPALATGSLDLEHALPARGEKAGEARTVGARALERPSAPLGCVFARQPERATVAARREAAILSERQLRCVRASTSASACESPCVSTPMTEPTSSGSIGLPPVRERRWCRS
jgi:hypothetical protein